MASIKKHKSGWRAQIERVGVRKSKVFPTRQEAKDWAAATEAEILTGKSPAAAMTFGALMERYARERSPAKRGARWEMIRLERIGKDKLARVMLADLSATDFADWRDRRGRDVAPGSVLREMQLLNTVLTVAVKEWRLLDEHPMADVKKPAKPLPRDRLPTWSELRRLRYAAGADLDKATARAFWAFAFAMRTAMRAGEICHLEWRDLDLAKQVARLRMTKNGHPRSVPLSSKAVAMLLALPKADPVFGLTTTQLDALFRKIKGRALVDGLHFHDSRAAAITRLSKRLDILELARVVGHRDLGMLQVYYRTAPEDLAKRLG